ncbi:dead deah box protein [Apiospora kogelbergensis]|uniref:dead deah box protein n=1 Tax=Apiospora kogelbergensis TaxID=1337665 RepID=UPI0031307651
MADQDPAVGKQSPSPSETDLIKQPPSSATEDPDTAAARKELRNTVISDKPDLAPSSTMASSTATDPDAAAAPKDTPDYENKMKDQISSPKKKRAHDEVDQNKDSAQDANGDVSPLGADANLSRTNRSEPEKKRPRDVSSETKAAEEKTASKDTKEGGDKTTKTTSSSAFSSSGLSGFANTASPFLSSAGAKPLTSFASPSGSLSPFGAAATTKTDTTKSVFGGAGLSNGGASPFSQPSSSSKTSVFGSGAGLGGGLTGLGGSKLTSFGKPGESFKSSKPAKPFGAPESDAESDAEEADNGDDNAGDEDREEKEADDDKKKVKLQKTNVDDGEAGEVTVLQLRARIYFLDKSATPAAWKERGAGNLKINVPEACVDLDDNNIPIPGSFDASTLEDAENKNVRLIMRQDSTHRLLLNTVVIPAMSFQEKPTNKTVCILFTAIEDKGEPVSIQLKFNPANAKNFLNEVGKIQRELQSN